MTEGVNPIDTAFLVWCERYGYDVNEYALDCYTRSGDRELDFQNFMQGKTRKEVLQLLDKPIV
jgi:hypothetical protein